MNMAQSLARLPICTKGRVLEKIARRLTEAGDLQMVQTNLGLDNKLKFSVPSNNYSYAFGRPSGHIAERGTLALAKQLSPHSDLFIDVGANYGLFSAAVKLTRPELEVWAVEGDPDLAENLTRNCEASGLAITVHNAAASNISGKVRFFRNDDDKSSGSLTTHFAAKHRLSEIEVDAVRLSDYVIGSQRRRVLVKIDVEGAGALVWEGLKDARDHIFAMIVEVIGPESEVRLPEQICSATGWHSYYIDDLSIRRVSFSEYTYKEPFWNWLFTKLAPAELAAKLEHPLRVFP